jgi:protein involved in polysaccharide export with SLBB domain
MKKIKGIIMIRIAVCLLFIITTISSAYCLDVKDLDSIDIKKLSNIEKSEKESAGGDYNFKNDTVNEAETKKEIDVKDQPEETDGYVFFGHDIFNSSQNFITDQNANVSDSYMIGAGDALNISFWGRLSKSEGVSVDRNGNIFSEILGKIHVAGLTFSELKSKVADVVGNIEGVDADVAIAQTKSTKVFLAGNVKEPGYYLLGAYSTVTQAISNAGGVKDSADIRNVRVIRKGKTVRDIDYYSLIKKGIDPSADFSFQPNDVVFVPESNKRVLVIGAVKQQAYFDLKNENNLADVIELAGGLGADALRENINIRQVTGNKEFQLKKVDGNFRSIKVEDGDTVLVPKIKDEEESIVTLSGNVYYPGKYQFREGLRVSDIIKSYKDLKDNTLLENAYILRRGASRSENQVIAFSIEKALEKVGSIEDISLKVFDEIVVLNKFALRKEASINVSGEVAEPGDYSVEGNITVHELISKAGGFTSESDPNGIEVFKYENGKINITTIDAETAISTLAPTHGYVTVYNIFDKSPIEYIEIYGEVHNEGEFIYSKNVGLFKLLSYVGYKLQPDTPASVVIYRKNHINGDYVFLEYDLDQLLAMQKDISLKAGDRLYVNEEKTVLNTNNYISVSGAVDKPGNYTYAHGITVSSALRLAGGVTDMAYANDIELIRKEIVDGVVKMNYISVNMLDSADTLLKPGDKLMVKEVVDANFSSYVTVKGEVKYPGTYPVRKGERISSVLARAGGFTEHAYPYGSKLIRASVKRSKKESLNKLVTKIERQMLLNANSTATTSIGASGVQAATAMVETQREFVNSLKKIVPEGRLVLNFTHPRLMKGSSNDIVVENNDFIFVPQKTDTVNVVGAVLNSGAFVYSDEMRWEDYVKLAGGYNRNADKSNIYILRANGTAQSINSDFIDWSEENNRWEFTVFADRIELKPGDNIVVPENYAKYPWLRNIKDITQVMMQIAVTGGIAGKGF